MSSVLVPCLLLIVLSASGSKAQTACNGYSGLCEISVKTCPRPNCLRCLNGICKKCMIGFTEQANGECVRCKDVNCAMCSPDGNTCVRCRTSTFDLKDGACVPAGQALGGDPAVKPACPPGCKSCSYTGNQCYCLPCGEVYQPLPGDTLYTIADMCLGGPSTTNLQQLKAKNGIPQAFGNTDAAIPVSTLTMPSTLTCENPRVNAQCDATKVWMSMATGDGMVKYGCVDPSVCQKLYQDCVDATMTCPNCCFSRTCTNSVTNVQEIWYFATVPGPADRPDLGWSMHCDPPRGCNGCSGRKRRLLKGI